MDCPHLSKIKLFNRTFSMGKISNNNKERMVITHSRVYFDNVFNDEEIEKIIQYCQKYQVETGTVGDKVLDQNIRKSNIKFHNRNNDSAWIFDRLNWAIERMNDDFYSFDLSGYNYFQYSEYESSQQGKYDFHIDMFMGNSIPADAFATRKLSITFLLNEPGVDFEGGDFQITLGREAAAENVEMKKGRIIAFPSFVVHRVTPVTKGVRKSIVVWVEGPKFK